MASYKGIDYGCGTTNIDKSNGIRYGVINAHALTEWIYEDFEDDFGEPTCPKCGNELVETNDEEHGEYKYYRDCWPWYKDGEKCHHVGEYACEECGITIDGEDSYSEEPVSRTMDKDGYKASLGSDMDIFLVKSPYYTHAQFCSPCAPGAGHLENYCPDGPKTYCFDKDFFQDGKCPYPIYSVETNELLYSPPQEEEQE